MQLNRTVPRFIIKLAKMSAQSRQLLCNLAYKSIPCCNAKKIPALLTTVKRNKNYLRIVRSTCHSTTQAGQNISKYSHPTHYLCYRSIQSDGSNKTDSKSDRKLPATNITFLYSFKFLYALLRDNGVKYHVDRSFVAGTLGAFRYISDCIAEQNYDGLTAVVTPELLEIIKHHDDTIRSDNSSPEIFIAKDVLLISLVDMNWSIDRSTKIKTVEVLLRYTYFKEKVDIPTLQDMRELGGSGTLQGVPCNMAHVKFFRTYGETMKDSPWVVKHLFCFPVKDRWKITKRTM